MTVTGQVDHPVLHFPSSVSFTFLQHNSQLTLHRPDESDRICKSAASRLGMRCGSLASGMSVSVLSFLLCHFSCSSSWRCSFPPLLSLCTAALMLWTGFSPQRKKPCWDICAWQQVFRLACVGVCVCVCVRLCVQYPCQRTSSLPCVSAQHLSLRSFLSLAQKKSEAENYSCTGTLSVSQVQSGGPRAWSRAGCVVDVKTSCLSWCR